MRLTPTAFELLTTVSGRSDRDCRGFHSVLRSNGRRIPVILVEEVD